MQCLAHPLGVLLGASWHAAGGGQGTRGMCFAVFFFGGRITEQRCLQLNYAHLEQGGMHGGGVRVALGLKPWRGRQASRPSWFKTSAPHLWWHSSTRSVKGRQACCCRSSSSRDWKWCACAAWGVTKGKKVCSTISTSSEARGPIPPRIGSWASSQVPTSSKACVAAKEGWEDVEACLPQSHSRLPRGAPCKVRSAGWA